MCRPCQADGRPVANDRAALRDTNIVGCYANIDAPHQFARLRIQLQQAIGQVGTNVQTLVVRRQRQPLGISALRRGRGGFR